MAMSCGVTGYEYAMASGGHAAPRLQLQPTRVLLLGGVRFPEPVVPVLLFLSLVLRKERTWHLRSPVSAR